MQDIHPVKPPIDLPLLTETQRAVLYVIIGVILILLIWTVWNWVSKTFLTKKLNPEPPPIPPRNYEKEALTKLLKIQSLIQEHKLHDFYLEISTIVRQYYTDKYQINVSDMTTTEVKQSNQARDTMGESRHEFLIQFLTKVDTVKFSHTDTDKQEAEKVYGRLNEFLTTIHRHSGRSPEGTETRNPLSSQGDLFK